MGWRLHWLFRLAAVAGIAVSILSRPVRAAEQVETYPDGKQKGVYAVGEDGAKNGPFKEFFPDGKLKAQGAYRQGKLSGPYKGYHPNGRMKTKAAYRDGQLAGACTEYGEEGPIVRKAAYRDGRLHGPQQEFAEGRLVKDEVWLDGQLLIPRSPAMLAAELAAIQKAPIETAGQVPAVSAKVLAAVKDPALHAKREAALRMLMAYRCICGLPYQDLQLDWTYIAHCEAASQLLTRINKLEHTPANPGMPEDEFRLAYQGTSSSNLFSASSPVEAVRSFMDDSDKSNIDRLGHRRWCLNPAMQRTGFGSSGTFTAMWSFDSSRKEVPEYDCVAYPPRGLSPASSIGEGYAWSVSPNPKKYEIPDQKEIKVQVFPARLNLRQGTLEKAAAPLALNYFNVSTAGFGGSSCIIFRPAGVRVSAGAAYWVEIKGLKDAGGQAAPIEYLVGFVAL
jgi:hypothetical protein